MSVVGPSTSLKNYRLVAELGHGGMADVFLAVAEGPVGFNKLVVVKRVRPELAQDPDTLAMFLDEARLAARLNHPNIVQTYEIGHEGDQYFIAMEYLEGKALQVARSATHGGMPFPAQLRVLADVLAALDYAHELRDFDGTPLKLVHRDVSPQNILITYQGSIKLVDFGIAKAVDSSLQTRTGVVKGKVSYMAPEQARGEGVDRRADVYAAGVLLWEATAGRRMWKNVPDIAVLHEIMNGRFPSLRDAVPDVPPELERICRLALAPEPDHRYPSADAMHAELEAFIARQPERPTAREIGTALATRFAADRQRVHEIIESQLRDVRWSGTNPRVTGVALPNVAPTGLQPTPSAPTRIEASGAQIAVGGRTGGSLTASLVTPGGPPRRPILAFVLAGGAAFAALAFGARALTNRAPPPAAASDASSREAATAAPIDPAPAVPLAPKVKLAVHVQPAEARVLLDGVLLATGGFEGEVAKAADAHVLRVEADRFVAREQKISLAGDLVVDVALAAEAPVPAHAAPPVGPRPRPAKHPPPTPVPEVAPPPAAPATGQRPSREIDRDNPYGKKP